jgi:uncharacterized protein (TIGR00251 family)
MAKSVAYPLRQRSSRADRRCLLAFGAGKPRTRRRPFQGVLRWSAVDWRQAVTQTDNGVRRELEGRSGAKRAAFPDGFNEWRGRIGIAVRAPAQDGKANADVLAVVADFFGASLGDVKLVAGATDSRKAVAVDLPMDEAERRLGSALD